MAKKRRTKDEYAGTKYERQHWRNINTYQKQVENQLDEAVNDAARIGASLADNVNEDEVFSFDDQSPRVQRQADNIINTLQRNIVAIITNGIATEWQLSVDKNNDMSQDWLIENGNTANTLEAFLQRQENGLGLSDRVWKYTGQFRDELELALSIGIKHGVSAAELSRNVRRSLNNPSMLFRRVRNKYGQLVLSRNAAAYHPGQGVYRSSYRNAIRLTGTETNIAYRTADYNTWMALDFVVGMEVHLSNNHNCKGVPNGEFEDICDQLAGKYPKDFQFTGWHPNCRCYSTAITKTSAEIAEDSRRMMQGLPPLPPESSVNYVRDVPQGFKDWVNTNSERIASAKSLPYFIRDNQTYVNNILNNIPSEIKEARRQFNAYGRSWDKPYFDRKTGGFVVIDRARLRSASASKNATKIFNKEYNMAVVFANNGYRIEMLREVPRVRSYDATINGTPADFKRVTSANNIVKRAKLAVRNQGAQLVLFQFDKMNKSIEERIAQLIRLNIHGKYFITGQHKTFDF